MDCDTCRTYHLDEDYQPVVLFGGERMKRIGPTPCDTETGCEKGHYTGPVSLSGYAAAVLYTYRLSEGIRSFPQEEWFATFAAIIKTIDERHERHGRNT